MFAYVVGAEDFVVSGDDTVVVDTSEEPDGVPTFVLENTIGCVSCQIRKDHLSGLVETIRYSTHWFEGRNDHCWGSA